MTTDKHLITAIIFLAFLLLIIGVALYIWLKSRQGEGDAKTIKTGLYKFRFRYFIGVTAGLIVLSAITLSFLPFKQSIKAPAQVKVAVVARQWYWTMAKGTLSPNNLDIDGVDSLVLPLNKEIEFQVTSGDVNHGFGIYNAHGQLLGQTQAMPGFINDLKFKFTKPGVYHIVCMEYCGMAHQAMDSKFYVR